MYFIDEQVFKETIFATKTHVHSKKVIHLARIELATFSVLG